MHGSARGQLVAPCTSARAPASARKLDGRQPHKGRFPAREQCVVCQWSRPEGCPCARRAKNANPSEQYNQSSSRDGGRLRQLGSGSRWGACDGCTGGRRRRSEGTVTLSASRTRLCSRSWPSGECVWCGRRARTREPRDAAPLISARGRHVAWGPFGPRGASARRRPRRVVGSQPHYAVPATTTGLLCQATRGTCRPRSESTMPEPHQIQRKVYGLQIA
mmetsp:Transcript_17468/g.29714  ORF Transcript_17468/g.29714 Transcript_17468/m.29714 type:complete len:219 (-) Transcript_17468:1192-1848(-)